MHQLTPLNTAKINKNHYVYDLDYMIWTTELSNMSSTAVNASAPDLDPNICMIVRLLHFKTLSLL